VTAPSSLPPLKKTDGKYIVIALLLLLGAGALWFFVKTDGSESEVEVVQPTPDASVREQFAPEIEIPEQEAPDGGPDDASVAKTMQPSPSPADWECYGTIDEAAVLNVINGQPRKQVQTCYERRLKDDNLLQGSMKVLLTIGASGNVRTVSVDGSLDDPTVFACVRRVARTWKFPEPKGGCVRIAVPFQMTPEPQ
jgi:outer membrane biosynthesis protein TonB